MTNATHHLRTLVLGALALSLAAGCYKYRPLRAEVTRARAVAPSGVLLVANFTPDPLAVEAESGGRATIAPGTEAELRPVPAGDVRIEATARLADVSYRTTVTLDAGETGRWEVHPRASVLQVDNPLDEEVEILVDGEVVGRAAAGASAVLEDVPAGTRTLVARTSGGSPYDVRLVQPLVETTPFRWVLPERVAGKLARVPAGKGLILLTNHSIYTVRVVVGDGQIVQVPPKGKTRIIVEPGAHKLEAHVMGSSIASIHSVEVAADQVAAWDYGLDEE